MNDLECPECPYCNAIIKLCHEDGQCYAEEKDHELSCGECGKNFIVHTTVSYYYSPRKADCLNGSPHRFTSWQRLWESEQDRMCIDCEHRERRTLPMAPAKTKNLSHKTP